MGLIRSQPRAVDTAESAIFMMGLARLLKLMASKYLVCVLVCTIDSEYELGWRSSVSTWFSAFIPEVFFCRYLPPAWTTASLAFEIARDPTLSLLGMVLHPGGSRQTIRTEKSRTRRFKIKHLTTSISPLHRCFSFSEEQNMI